MARSWHQEDLKDRQSTRKAIKPSQNIIMVSLFVGIMIGFLRLKSF